MRTWLRSPVNAIVGKAAGKSQLYLDLQAGTRSPFAQIAATPRQHGERAKSTRSAPSRIELSTGGAA